MYGCDLWCVQTKSHCNALETPLQKPHSTPLYFKTESIKHAIEFKVFANQLVLLEIHLVFNLTQGV